MQKMNTPDKQQSLKNAVIPYQKQTVQLKKIAYSILYFLLDMLWGSILIFDTLLRMFHYTDV